MSESESESPRALKGPCSIAPDCSWAPMTHNSCLPENVVFHNGELNGDKVFVGRVNDGKCVYVGTAIPDKGICIYLDKNLQVHSSQDYEILTAHGDPLWFVEASSLDKVQHNQFTGGIDENEEVLYVGRYIDSKYNTYYGWLFQDFEKIYIPRDAMDGPQVVDEGFSVLIHRYLHRMCTGCPMPVKGVNYF